MKIIPPLVHCSLDHVIGTLSSNAIIENVSRFPKSVTTEMIVETDLTSSDAVSLLVLLFHNKRIAVT